MLLPFLGQQYGDVLEAGELRWEYDRGGFALRYFEHCFRSRRRRTRSCSTAPQPASLASFAPLFAALDTMPVRTERRAAASSLRRLLAETEDADSARARARCWTSSARRRRARR